jgi:hypothetical protein
MSGDALRAWTVDSGAFPTSGSLADKARFAVGYAILAPSTHNTQPWKFAIIGDELMLMADRSRSLPIIDPFDRELVISCGAALLNLRVVFAHFGVPVEIATFPQAAEPDLLVRVNFPNGGRVTTELNELFVSITERTTNRHLFAAEELPNDFLASLQAASAAEGIDLGLLHSTADRARVGALVAEADHRQFSDPHFRHELARWIHPSRSFDGMPAYAPLLGELTAVATPIVTMALRTFDLGGGVAASHERLVRGSPLLAVFSTRVDDDEAWLLTGQALERVLLLAAKSGYQASYLNQPIEIPELRERLAAEARVAPYPQVMLRLRRGPIVPHAPRRPLEDALS